MYFYSVYRFNSDVLTDYCDGPLTKETIPKPVCVATKNRLSSGRLAVIHGSTRFSPTSNTYVIVTFLGTITCPCFRGSFWPKVPRQLVSVHRTLSLTGRNDGMGYPHDQLRKWRSSIGYPSMRRCQEAYLLERCIRPWFGRHLRAPW